MALSIRRGASRVFRLSLENCVAFDYLWKDLGTIRVRLSQGGIVVDKTPTIMTSDATSCLVYYSQEDTIRFSDQAKAKIQVFALKESTYHQLAVKSEIYDVEVYPSLWNEAITDGKYSGNESLNLDSPAFQDPVGHDYYGYMHIDIKEFSGIISEVSGNILQGANLVYNPTTETLRSS